MAKNYWECSICGRRSNKKTEITRCERSHRKIADVIYHYRDGCGILIMEDKSMHYFDVKEIVKKGV